VAGRGDRGLKGLVTDAGVRILAVMEPTALRAARPVAVVVWAIAAVALAVALAATWLGLAGGGATGGSVKAVILTAVWIVPGVLITRFRQGRVLGRLALGEAVLFAAAGLGDQWVRRPGISETDAGVDWAVWVTDRFSAFLAVGVWLVLVLLPDGRLPSRRWRPVVGVIVTAQCAALAAFATTRGPAAGPDSALPAEVQDVANPVGVLPAGVGEAVEGLDTVLLQVPLVLCLVAYVVRLRGAGPDERVRVVGVLLAASTFVLLVVLGHAWWPQAAETLDVLAGGLLAAQLTATVLGRRSHTIATVARQTFVHTVLVAVVAGLAVLVTTVFGLLGQDLPLFGVAVVAGGAALAVQPLRTRLAELVDRLLYGDLRDPYLALQRLAAQTHAAPSVDAVLTGMAATVAASLRVPWTEVEAAGHVHSWGERPGGGETVSAELVSGTARVGAVTVAPGRRLRAEELVLLTELGRHGGVAVQAVLLTDALRAGRLRLVVAREEERRRLRRDLHDGVGPTLAGLTMQLGVVRPLVRTDPDAVADRLGHLQEAARGALETVRRLSHGLRPPALDELGVAGALRQLAESLGLRAVFPDADPPRLPAAVEVAVYLIAAEALHNVARHAGIGDVQVSLQADDENVTLSVRDSGPGVDAARPAGIGLTTMRERADELGGTVTVESAPQRGTTVTARVPVRDTAAAVLR
jgi:two-component system NarL family sensor kinase